ncbi:MAG: tRNA preQ1(34) S-adenosylmethionine ribosyltransferase-isomerase QueA [Actinobacteria bacterium]|nr:tRNA preQ1(34) S-adenosylmethionine ribosyltransferase-isomerase QueA [Actinomycetota bacterium]MDA3010013.1 tRNA preQ1(34) S-adenosylmethionine ribosyltransferase-isomerase QueA [Actinomycetota bacterium]
MSADEFDYDLPPELIAQEPIEPRSAARLLVDRGSRPSEHLQVSQFPDLVGEGDLVVVNETRVLPARLSLKRGSGGSVEILLLELVDGRRWRALARPGRKLREGEVLLSSGEQEVVEIVGRDSSDDGQFIVELLAEPERLAEIGEMPLPPYITTPLVDPERYQTVYAKRAASAAAPTAGLHFTPELMEQVEASGARIARVELVVGLDTFRPLAVDDVRQHRMHSEQFSVPEHVLAEIADARRVIAVGTTATRAIETAGTTGRLSGRTEIFISRGFRWSVVDVMLTNFHLPRTTLLVMIDAFVGRRWRDLYKEAIRERYRMLSFGDAMLLDRHAQ